MIVEKMVPTVYYKESRDFAYIGRLLEIVFNYMKMQADCVAVNPDNEYVNSNILDLISRTLGFESHHEYNLRDLVYITSSFQEILRKKGTLSGISDTVQLLINSQNLGISDLERYAEIDEDDATMINIYIPENLTDIILLEDILEYIIPAGMLYRFKRISTTRTIERFTTIIEDSIMQSTFSNLEEGWKSGSKTDSELSTIYGSDQTEEEYNQETREELQLHAIGTGVIKSKDNTTEGEE